MITAILPSPVLIDSPLIPSFIPLSQLDELVALLPRKLRMTGLRLGKFKPHNQLPILITPGE
jgi:hypothetical protein